MGFTNRRQFLTQTAALPLVSGLWRTPESTDFFDSQPGPVHSYRQELPDMLLSFVAKKTNSLAAEWDQVRSRIQTASEMEERNRFVREKITAMLGGFPPRNPLSPVVARVVERDGYRIENVRFQSRPNFWVTGNLLLLIGENLTQYRIWDGMRAIDYLLTRPEVDSKRIGCTGQSGGGTLTLFISALDERVRCAVMHEGGTRRRWPLEIRPETP